MRTAKEKKTKSEIFLFEDPHGLDRPIGPFVGHSEYILMIQTQNFGTC